MGRGVNRAPPAPPKPPPPNPAPPRPRPAAPALNRQIGLRLLPLRIVRAGETARALCNRGIVGMDLEWASQRRRGVVNHLMQNAVGLLLIVVDPLPIAPAVRREQQRHRVILLAVRRGAGGARRPVWIDRPRKEPVVGIVGVGDLHVRVRPVPQCVELMLLVHLHRDHHPVAHAFAACVIVRPVGDESQRAILVRSRLEVHALGLRIAVEQLLKRLVDLRAGLGRGMSLLGEQVPVRVLRIRARAISRHVRNVAERSVHMRRRRHETSHSLASAGLVGSCRN